MGLHMHNLNWVIEAEEDLSGHPLDPARAVVLGVALSSGLWVGLAILVRTLW
ncbi:hypothetical protein [Paracraurococcus lichenis]|uniref:Uncharacterized protein n=1 Tax=Paracraurococcus lichenis TaxID=3064888 RepID=A0ABT9DSE6_9PROT|nr:hypothetical protein [Paracraurococcus sp. LOR1-02]MDO9706822.1 hypothetical protein [Paracraurococcus sp. LOR1-02]